MNPAPRLARRRTPLALVILALLAGGGIALGWLRPPAYSRTLDQVLARLAPVSMGALCIGLIRLQVKQRRATILATLLSCCAFAAAVHALWRL
jgi:peptidoglycan/LPS O-acetylase OafA/YrhL